MRAFVAIPLSEEIAELLVAARESIVQADPAWRGEKWVPAENLHLTLRFLGSLPDAEAPAVAAALAEAVRGIAPFDLVVSGVRAVPSPHRATMMWATFSDPSDRAPLLAKAVLRATDAWVDEPPGKPFRPHATLVRARGKRRVAAEALAAAEAAIGAAAVRGEDSMSVSRVMLVASTLTASRPVYEEISSAVLDGD